MPERDKMEESVCHSSTGMSGYPPGSKTKHGRSSPCISFACLTNAFIWTNRAARISTAYKRLLRTLRPGDVLAVQSIDRLGRNYEEILEQWRLLTKKKGVAMVVLDMPLLDTRNTRDLTGTLIADIVLQLLSYVAQKERESIRQRQAEGIAAAKERGVRFGRPEKEIPGRFFLLYDDWKKGEISGREAARQLGVTHQTFFKWVGQMA